MENNNEALLMICDLISNPEQYKSINIESICATLEILHYRIMKIDSSILSDYLSKEEYEKYFEELLSSVHSEGISELIADIKNNYDNTGDAKNEND